MITRTGKTSHTMNSSLLLFLLLNGLTLNAVLATPLKTPDSSATSLHKRQSYGQVTVYTDTACSQGAVAIEKWVNGPLRNQMHPTQKSIKVTQR